MKEIEPPVPDHVHVCGWHRGSSRWWNIVHIADAHQRLHTEERPTQEDFDVNSAR